MYDPYISRTISANQPYPDSYWFKQYQLQQGQPRKVAELTTSITTDVAIIGAGYTGMNCALSLADLGIGSVILEANQPAWGCAGRNAGFILPGSGRLGYSALKKQYGEPAATICYQDYYEALESITERIEQMTQSVELVDSGYLKIAHNHKAADAMSAEWQNLPEQYKQQSCWVTQEEIHQHFIPGYQGHAALFRESGQALNPLRYGLGLGDLVANSSDIDLYGDSPVLSLTKRADKYHLITSKGNVIADKVVICSNAYTPTKLHSMMNQQFPVLSSILVTSPIPDDIAQGWSPHLTAMDTRSLKYYYRILPDNRILFGGRGAISGKHANTLESQQALKNVFKQYFPDLANLDISHFWSGWVSVAFDDIPHIGKTSDDENIYFATGYCGSGVSFATHAGKRLAQLLSGQTLPVFDSPIYKKPLPRFPFSPFRRWGLSAFYGWQKCLDRLL